MLVSIWLSVIWLCVCLCVEKGKVEVNPTVSKFSVHRQVAIKRKKKKKHNGLKLCDEVFLYYDGGLGSNPRIFLSPG